MLEDKRTGPDSFRDMRRGVALKCVQCQLPAMRLGKPALAPLLRELFRAHGSSDHSEQSNGTVVPLDSKGPLRPDSQCKLWA